MQDELGKAISETSSQPGIIDPSEFTAEVNSQGQKSVIGEYTADTGTLLREGRENPLKVAIPAYEKFTTDGSAGDTETFNLTHSVVDTPVTQSVIVWLDGTYYGTPDSVDYSANTIDVTDPNTNSNVHVYYISDKAATLELRKVAPGESTSQSQRVYNANLGLVHSSPQLEQPEYLTLNDTPLQPWVPTDSKLTLYINAPYTVRWTDNDGDGTEPTNALFNVPAHIGSREIPGLAGAVRTDMGQA